MMIKHLEMRDDIWSENLASCALPSPVRAGMGVRVVSWYREVRWYRENVQYRHLTVKTDGIVKGKLKSVGIDISP